MSEEVELSAAMVAREAAEAGETPVKAPEAVETPAGKPAEAPQSADTPAEAAEQPEASDDAPEAPEGEDKADKERSKPASKRIAEITKARREAERRAELAEAELARLRAGSTPQEKTGEKPDPNDAKYEFGEADPNYIADLVDWRTEQRLAEREAKNAQSAEETARKAQAEALDAQWKEKVATATEKYPDFQERVLDSAAAGEWELMPLSAAAVASSPVGVDVASYLADHPAEAKKLANAEREFHEARAALMSTPGMTPQLVAMLTKPHMAAATAIFENIEGQFKNAAKPQAKIATDAPEPPSQRARGAGGQFTPDYSSETCDLSALNKAIRG